MIDRRQFLTRALAAAGLIAVPELILPERKVWALDRTMVPAGRFMGPAEMHVVPMTEYLRVATMIAGERIWTADLVVVGPDGKVYRSSSETRSSMLPFGIAMTTADSGSIVNTFRSYH